MLLGAHHENIISRRGLHICICSVLSSIAYSVALTGDNVVRKGWAFTAVFCGFYTITILWMLIKLELDEDKATWEQSTKVFEDSSRHRDWSPRSFHAR